MTDAQAALERDPEFAMAHVIKGLLYALSTERRLLPEARTARHAARALAHYPLVMNVTRSLEGALVPWEQQVRFSAAHDVLLGVHGNGLTNALWMRPGSLVLEFFPPGARHYDYQVFAELCGLDYFGFEGDRVFPAFCRFGEPYGHGEKTNQVIRSIALTAVERIVDAWVARRGFKVIR